MLPILLNLSHQNCLIVGGGSVAARKAKTLLSAGADRLSAIAPAFSQSFPPAVHRVVAPYQSSYMAGVTLVFAATDQPAVNDQVVRDARERHILCNRIDAGDELAGDFTTPAYWQDGPVTVAVSAGSAALSAKLRGEVQSQWRPSWTKMAEAMQMLRQDLKARFDEPTRAKLFRLLAEDSAIDTLERGGLEALKEYISQQAHP